MFVCYCKDCHIAILQWLYLNRIWYSNDCHILILQWLYLNGICYSNDCHMPILLWLYLNGICCCRDCHIAILQWLYLNGICYSHHADFSFKVDHIKGTCRLYSLRIHKNSRCIRITALTYKLKIIYQYDMTVCSSHSWRKVLSLISCPPGTRWLNTNWH